MPAGKVAMPGDNLEIDVELLYPTPISEGQRFAMREGQLTIGAGVIAKVLADAAPVADSSKPAAAGDKKDAKPAAGAAKPAAGAAKPAAPKAAPAPKK